MEAHKKIVAARSAAINKEIKELPVRISEVQRQMPDVAGLDEESLREDIATLRGRIEAREAKVSRILSGGGFGKGKAASGNRRRAVGH